MECKESNPYPSFSKSPLQSTTEPPVPILSRVCKLTEIKTKQMKLNNKRTSVPLKRT